jgi:hypothetical protein
MIEFGYVFLTIGFIVIGLYAAMIIYAISGWKKLKTE